MNSSVWAVWAELAVRKKSGFEFFWATFEGVFFNFLRAKKIIFLRIKKKIKLTLFYAILFSTDATIYFLKI